MDSSARERLLTEALSWQGTPWHHRGRVKGVGVDCLHFVAAVYERAGLAPHVDPGPYPRDWHMHRDEERILQGVGQYAEEVDAQVDTPEPGDIAVFRFGRCYSHAAIVLDWPLVIHAYVGQGVRQADASTGALAGRPIKFFRIRS